MANQTYGAIKLSDANAVGSMLVKKMGGVGYAPKDWADTINLMGALPEKTASGSIAHIEDGADRVPLKAWDVTLPASLSGYSSIVATKAGKNLLDETLKKLNGRNIYYNTGTNQNDGYSCILPAGTYTFSVTTADGTITNLYARNYDTSTNISGFPAYGVLKKTFTLAEKTRVSFWIYKDTYTSLSDIVNAQVEVGSTNTEHADYTAPTQYTDSLGRTIYGGTADVVTGEGVDGYEKGSMSSTYLSGLSSDYIGYESSTAYFGGHPSIWVRNWNYQRAKARQSGGIGCACNYFPVSMHNTTIFSSQYRIYFDVDGKNISSVADFIAFVTALEQNNESLDIVYELNDTYKTSFTFTPITPTPHTALGTNNLWNDRGDSEVTYRRDIDLALNSGSSLLGFGLGNPNAGQESEE